MNPFLRRYEQWGFAQDQTATTQKSIRVNNLKISEAALVARLTKKGATLTKIPYLAHGYHVEAPFSLGATTEYLLGYYYLQEGAAQLPIDILQPKKNWTVIDACASPGGKTTQIAQYMENTGSILALDNNSNRLHSLKGNIERCGCTNTAVIHKDAQYLDELDTKADAILIDAPCSGNFVIEPHWFKKRSLQDFKAKQQVQKKIIASAYKSLKAGGELVYSTCSLEKEENEDVVEWALEHFDALTLIPIKAKTGSPGLSEKTKGCLRMWPTQHGTQGFFVAHLKKV